MQGGTDDLRPMRRWTREEFERLIEAGILGEDERLERLPGPADILLLLEVADSSRPFDPGRKAQLYARAGIHDYWVSDADENCVLVHRDQSPDGYRTITRHRAGEQVSPLQTGAPVPVAALVA